MLTYRQVDEAIRKTECYDFDIEDQETDEALDLVFAAASAYRKILKAQEENAK